MEQKLKSRRGMTLTELLVSMAIMALLSVGIATGVSAAGAAQRDNLALSEASLLLDSVTKAVLGELRYARITAPAASPAPVPPAGYSLVYDSQIQYLSTVYGLDARFYTAENGDGLNRIFVEANGKSYSLLGEGAYTNLGAGIKALSYDPVTGRFTVELAVTLPGGREQSYPPVQIHPIFDA